MYSTGRSFCDGQSKEQGQSDPYVSPYLQKSDIRKLHRPFKKYYILLIIKVL